MARQKKIKLVHPLTALDSLRQFSEDVSMVLANAENAALILTKPTEFNAASMTFAAKNLRASIEGVRAHYESEEQG